MSKEGIYDTIAHEIGHNAEEVLVQSNPAVVEAWNQLYEEGMERLVASGGEENEFVSPYAETSAAEDFAESYAAYLNDPEWLQAISPQKFDFMATKVFS